MPKIDGPVISCRSPISSFAHCSPSSSLISTLVKSSMWGSLALQPTPGRHNNCGKRLASGQGPQYLIRDRDSKFGSCFVRVAATSSIKIVKTPYHTPRANAICERFVGSVRRECLDHLLILQEKQLQRVLRAYVEYFNRARPHQGINQQIPEGYGEPVLPHHDDGKILALPVLGGLHHDYRRSA